MEKGKQTMMSGYGGSSSNGDSIIDRSEVKIILWESNAESQAEISTLLTKYSYQGKHYIIR